MIPLHHVPHEFRSADNCPHLRYVIAHSKPCVWASLSPRLEQSVKGKARPFILLSMVCVAQVRLRLSSSAVSEVAASCLLLADSLRFVVCFAESVSYSQHSWCFFLLRWETPFHKKSKPKYSFGNGTRFMAHISTRANMLRKQRKRRARRPLK